MVLLELTKWVHASLGVVCLLSGVAALIMPKRPRGHPWAGRIFGVSLGLLYLFILPNMIATRNVFLLAIGWLAVFAAFEGTQSLRRSLGRAEPRPGALDYLVNGITVIFCLGLGGFGALALRGGSFLGAVCLAFAVLGLLLVRAVRGRWREPPAPQVWLVVHIGMMCGAFSAALTAVLAVQFSGRLGGMEWVLWVAPSVAMQIVAQKQMKARGLTS